MYYLPISVMFLDTSRICRKSLADDRAVVQATKGLAAEFGPHQIRVNSICPLLSGTGL